MRLKRFRCYCFASYPYYVNRRVFQNEHKPSSTCIVCTTDRVVPTRKLFGIFCLPWYDDGRGILALMTRLWPEHWRIHWPRCEGLSVCTCREIPKNKSNNKIFIWKMYFSMNLYIFFCCFWGELIWYGDLLYKKKTCFTNSQFSSH